jgi:hypothetical protein
MVSKNILPDLLCNFLRSGKKGSKQPLQHIRKIIFIGFAAIQILLFTFDRVSTPAGVILLDKPVEYLVTPLRVSAASLGLAAWRAGVGITAWIRLVCMKQKHT